MGATPSPGNEVPIEKFSPAGKSLGVDPNCVRYWIGQLSDEPGMSPSGDGALAAEIQRLRKENARLLIEREILKKAAAFFAREQP